MAFGLETTVFFYFPLTWLIVLTLPCNTEMRSGL